MSSTLPTLQSYYWLLQVALVGLLYLSYVGIAGLLTITLSLFAKFKRTALDPLTRNGLLWMTGLLLLSCVFAENRPEAFLQLANFLPYFLYFAVIPFVLRGTERLERLALTLVIATIPINTIALIEYLLRSEFIPRSIRRIPFIRWVRDRPHAGRSMVMFDHPNWLASYLVLILGLGLGLILYHSLCQRSALSSQLSPKPLLYLGTFFCLVGIFCTGSRNGLIVAVSQLALLALCTRSNRTLLSAGLVGITSILAGAAWLGIGRRSLSLLSWLNDPRQRTWGIAIDLIRERPWLGWGLGNYKLQYPARLLAQYPKCIAEQQSDTVNVLCANVTHPHNFWLLLASEAGLIVAIGFTLWVGYLCFRAVKLLISKQLTPPDSAILLGYGFAFWSCIVFAFFDVTLYDARVNAIDWTVLAGLYAATEQGERGDRS
ncbi:MAG: O-antigen ligase family protein [Cyanobacteria bacterium CRU_2_1]|nr:O-antigen ligase family protein [Cyanobacteria bacterium RU_5_0]NJR59292.1 O-antigen ligase family protein [Cyanobacteria bacterium CRU_2_1]